MTITPGTGDSAYIRDRSGLIVGSITPGIGDRLYVRDRWGLIVGTLDATGGGVLLLPSD